MQKKMAESCSSSANEDMGACCPPKQRQMIHFANALLKDIFQKGKDYPWERPERCPCCSHWKVWGHGFVPAFFQGYDTPIFLKRYRCPACGVVIRLRPASHFSRFQSSRHSIRWALLYRINHGRWRSGSKKSQQRYWLRNLTRNAIFFLGINFPISKAFDLLIGLGKVPASCTI